jgi:hypothetical protein
MNPAPDVDAKRDKTLKPEPDIRHRRLGKNERGEQQRRLREHVAPRSMLLSVDQRLRFLGHTNSGVREVGIREPEFRDSPLAVFKPRNDVPSALILQNDLVEGIDHRSTVGTVQGNVGRSPDGLLEHHHPTSPDNQARGHESRRQGPLSELASFLR